jgi:outer membrane protein OmpA-like peptidoglycan-associated protein
MSVHDRGRRRAIVAGAGLGFGLGLGGVAAAAEPDTRSMIEALLPQAQRQMRNLVVRQKPEGLAAAVSAASGAASAAEPAVASAPPAALLPAGPAPSLALAIQFESNSARVRPESGAMLGNLVAAMLSPELKGTRFVIEGHSDARGAAAQNQRLSQERADEVRLYLVALGVHPARLRAVGKGAGELANPADPTAPENRRVRVVTQE